MTYTLLEIYESFHNGQKKQFRNQVNSYGPSDFATDLQAEINDGVLTVEEAYKMLREFLIFN